MEYYYREKLEVSSRDNSDIASKTMNYKNHIPKFPFPFLLSAVSSLKVQIFYSLRSSSIRFVLSRENEVIIGSYSL